MTGERDCTLEEGLTICSILSTKHPGMPGCVYLLSINFGKYPILSKTERLLILLVMMRAKAPTNLPARENAYMPDFVKKKHPGIPDFVHRPPKKQRNPPTARRDTGVRFPVSD